MYRHNLGFKFDDFCFVF